ncbi:diacylglycerol kinase [Sphingomonas psychrotolerans]|uniref:Diacylglycerol kinase n=1 Tax=Sphingomonas psychrotolerans TaxID=1327635 RepID=A0A2K8M9V9_9SPHN|nr:diacylglycerol kinase [Sphingomonas psychrotolerans]ATY30678.1 diacylglycerol kinase [Sphingomonas psychrotolerans]
MKNRPFRERMGFAFEGIRTGWRREASFRTQTILAGVALLALILLRPAPIWWGLVAVTCALVLALELLNSAMEAVIDLLHPDIHPSIKVAKDMLAGAVLAISIAAVIVGFAMVIATGPRFLAEIGL